MPRQCWTCAQIPQQTHGIPCQRADVSSKRGAGRVLLHFPLADGALIRSWQVLTRSSAVLNPEQLPALQHSREGRCPLWLRCSAAELPAPLCVLQGGCCTAPSTGLAFHPCPFGIIPLFCCCSPPPNPFAVGFISNPAVVAAVLQCRGCCSTCSPHGTALGWQEEQWKGGSTVSSASCCCFSLRPPWVLTQLPSSPSTLGRAALHLQPWGGCCSQGAAAAVPVQCFSDPQCMVWPWPGGL